jgi:hypothetical protein
MSIPNSSAENLVLAITEIAPPRLGCKREWLAKILRDLADPQPGDEEILVRMRAPSVNPLDWKIREGLLRLFVRLRLPYVTLPGTIGRCRFARSQVAIGYGLFGDLAFVQSVLGERLSRHLTA